MQTLFTREELKRAFESPTVGTSSGVGLYRNGYRTYGSAYWGLDPARAVQYFFEVYGSKVINSTVLDLGAGTGKNAFEFARHGAARVTAVEIDSIAVMTLISHLTALEETGLIPEDRIAVYKEDVTRFLTNQSEKYDIVVCYGLLHVYKDVQELRRILKLVCEIILPEGSLILQAITSKYPAPRSQPELADVVVTPSLVKEELLLYGLEVIYSNEDDIVHSHAETDEEHRHGSVRLISQKTSEVT